MSVVVFVLLSNDMIKDTTNIESMRLYLRYVICRGSFFSIQLIYMRERKKKCETKQKESDYNA